MEKQWWLLIWSPEGRPIAKVWAKDAKTAKLACPMPENKYLGEVGVVLLAEYEKYIGELRRYVPEIKR